MEITELLSRLSKTPGHILYKKMNTYLISVADLGCLSRIPDPTFSNSGSRVRIKKLKIFESKKLFHMI
jgi:hypothetical protein